MERKHLVNLVISISVGLMAAYPSANLADDTDIYLGAKNVSQEMRPNVLFILDTSGSMSSTVSGTGMDRLDNMKVALNKILTDVNNINVGLMRFTDPGGPILFPVSYIDEDVDVAEGRVEPGMNVSVRIQPTSSDGLSSTDDAEELVSSGAIDLSGNRLELPSTPAFGSGNSLDVALGDDWHHKALDGEIAGCGSQFQREGLDRAPILFAALFTDLCQGQQTPTV